MQWRKKLKKKAAKNNSIQAFSLDDFVKAGTQVRSIIEAVMLML